MAQGEWLHIDGPAGRIEAVWTPVTASRRAALLCHPHPLYGGSMDDAVVGVVEAALLRLGVATLRFNFRGVGDSEGAHDRGVGEVDDVLHLLRWLRVERGAEQVVLAGYSFGGGVALAAAERAEPSLEYLVLVAPALGRNAPAPGTPRCPLLLIQGGADRMVNGDAVRAWAQTLTSPVDVVTIPGADHFFTTGFAAITAAIDGRLS